MLTILHRRDIAVYAVLPLRQRRINVWKRQNFRNMCAGRRMEPQAYSMSILLDGARK